MGLRSLAEVSSSLMKSNFSFRMKNSLVVLENLTPTCTELARHLILSGINIWLRDIEGALVTQESVQSDFLFCASDIGKKVSLLFTVIIDPIKARRGCEKQAWRDESLC